MRILVVAQTLKELEWAHKHAAGSDTGREHWSILVLGDAARSSIKAAEKPPSNCEHIFLEDLEIDTEDVWREARDLQARLWHDISDDPRNQLHLATQWATADFLLRLAYIRAAVSAALRHIAPDEVRIPPYSISSVGEESPRAFKQLQWVVSFLAARSSIKRKQHWSTLAAYKAVSLLSVLAQVASFGLLAAHDLKRLVRFVYTAVFRKHFRPLTPDTGTHEGPEAERGKSIGPILITNSETDLRRQFNLNRLSTELSRRCLDWKPAAGLLSHFSNSTLSGGALSRSGHDAEPVDKASGYETLSAAHVAAMTRPTFATPLILKYLSIGYCSPMLFKAADEALSELHQLLYSRGMAEERLLNWRRIVFAGRFFAVARDLFKVLRPSLLVASDSGDVHRALTLAARHARVPSLATSHGIQMWSENFFDYYVLADMHCVFGKSYGLMTERNLPKTAARRAAYYDTSTWETGGSIKLAGNVEAQERRRVLIVTSFFSTSTSWANALFMRSDLYAQSLFELVEAIAGIHPKVEVTIKSHPLRDEYELYDRIQKAFPGVVGPQRREPYDEGELIPAEVVLFYNCVSTLFFSAAQQDIPILAHCGAFTTLARRISAAAELMGADHDGHALGNLVKEIFDDPLGETAERARAMSRAVSGKFLQPPLGGLNEAIHSATRGVDNSLAGEREGYYLAADLKG